MNTTPQNQQTGPGMSPDEARAALEQASRTSAVAPRDRTVYAVGTALFGVVLGAFVPLTRALDLDNGPSYLTAVYAVLAIAIATWQTRAARSVPRGAKRVGYVGLALTVVVSLACIMIANWREQTSPTSPGLLVLMGVVIALPMLVAGWVIARRRWPRRPRGTRGTVSTRSSTRRCGSGIVASLSAADEAEFSAVRDAVEVSRLGPVPTGQHPGGGRLRQGPQGVRGQAPADLAVADRGRTGRLRPASRGPSRHRRGLGLTRAVRAAAAERQPRWPRTDTWPESRLRAMVRRWISSVPS